MLIYVYDSWVYYGQLRYVYPYYLPLYVSHASPIFASVGHNQKIPQTKYGTPPRKSLCPMHQWARVAVRGEENLTFDKALRQTTTIHETFLH